MHSFNVYEAGGNTSEQGEKKANTYRRHIYVFHTKRVCRISVVEKDTNMHQDHICNEIV